MATKPMHLRANTVWLLIGLICGATIILAFAAGGAFWLANTNKRPRPAPEAEMVLEAQIGMPFQPLIPAYLPAYFDRREVEIHTDGLGPQGEAMLELVYPTKKGNQLVIQEWIPQEPQADTSVQCRCVCASPELCSPAEVGMQVGELRVAFKLSAANIITYEQLRFVFDTLGPAANQQIFSKMAEVPVTFNLPPAVDIPTNSDGVQEVTLVVTPDGYNPAHFAVKKDIPVRLVFRQVGQVGCGNELIFQWDKSKIVTLTLASQSDKKVVEFTPELTGDFRFSCPHLIYRGVMSVEE